MNIEQLKRIRNKLTDEETSFLFRLMQVDPLLSIYIKGLFLYTAVATLVLLWPFDFMLFDEPNQLRWIQETRGIQFSEPGQALSRRPREAFCGRLLGGNGFTLEVWCAPGDLKQKGPARIVSYSLNPALRNFTLGQSKDRLIMRLRTTETDLNGHPHVEVPEVFRRRDVQHIVVTYDYSVERVYVDGQKKAEEGLPGGSFSNWNPSCRLVLGNEVTGDRPWLGRIYYVAIYDRVLAEEEISGHYSIGWQGMAGDTVGDDPVVRYLFEEGEGSVIRDTGGLKRGVNLWVPAAMRTLEEAYLATSFDWFSQRRDIILNVLGLIPFGLLLHATLRTRWENSFRSIILALLAGALYSFAIESLQHFSLTRHSSAVDIGSNTIGVLGGIVLDKGYARKLRNRAGMLRWGRYDLRNTPTERDD